MHRFSPGRARAAAFVVLALFACAGGERESIAQGAQYARAELIDASGLRIGEATLREGPQGVLVELRLDAAPPGLRAFHVHEVGRCEPGFDAAGDHWNPHARQHGFMSPNGPHSGDLPNLHVPPDGRLEAELFLRDSRLSGNADGPGLLDGDGAAFILHAEADDHRTDPTGNAGDRIACGVIRG